MNLREHLGEDDVALAALNVELEYLGLAYREAWERVAARVAAEGFAFTVRGDRVVRRPPSHD